MVVTGQLDKPVYMYLHYMTDDANLKLTNDHIASYVATYTIIWCLLHELRAYTYPSIVAS